MPALSLAVIGILDFYPLRAWQVKAASVFGHDTFQVQSADFSEQPTTARFDTTGELHATVPALRNQAAQHSFPFEKGKLTQVFTVEPD